MLRERPVSRTVGGQAARRIASCSCCASSQRDCDSCVHA